MSKMNTEKKRKLDLKHETLRTLSARTLEEVVGGATTGTSTDLCGAPTTVV